MKWWNIKAEKEVYQNEEGDVIIISPIEGECNFEIKLIFDNFAREIIIKTTTEHKDKMIKMLQQEAEVPGKSNFSIFLK